jgi:hypothetical protein
MDAEWRVPAGAGEKTGARRVEAVLSAVKGGVLVLVCMAVSFDGDDEVMDAEAVFLVVAGDSLEEWGGEAGLAAGV